MAIIFFQERPLALPKGYLTGNRSCKECLDTTFSFVISQKNHYIKMAKKSAQLILIVFGDASCQASAQAHIHSHLINANGFTVCAQGQSIPISP